MKQKMREELKIITWKRLKSRDIIAFDYLFSLVLLIVALFLSLIYERNLHNDFTVYTFVIYSLFFFMMGSHGRISRLERDVLNLKERK